MRLVIAALALAVCTGSACASDKDTLRDACSALKSPSQKSQCFDALERIAPAQKVAEAPRPAAKPGPLMPNMRALECQPFEFSELDSMSKSDLQAAVCSVNLGNKRYNAQNTESIVSQANPNIKMALVRQGVSHMEQCRQLNTKATDLFLRKFPGESMDCSTLPGMEKVADAQQAPAHQ